MKLSFDNLFKDFGSGTVLNKVTGEINEGEIIGLIGANGVGKTTLAKILAYMEISDSGKVNYSPNNLRVKYVDQFPVFKENTTVYEEVMTDLLGKNQVYDPNPEVEAKARKALNSIGLDEKMWYQQAASLSGGEKTKLLLCKAMVGEFDFILLDEPSNHLDTEGCEALEEYILDMVRRGKAVLVVSHDRYFLDAVAGKIWELTSNGLAVYEGNYSAYRQQKEIETRNAEKEFNKQQVQIQQLKKAISDRRDWYASAHKAAGQNDFARAKAKKHAGVMKAKKQQLQRLEKNMVEKPKTGVSPAFEVINKGVSSHKLPPTLITGTNLVKKYGDKVIFNNAGFTVNRGDKIAIIGKNGSGKSTLLKMICGLDEEFGGTISVTPAVKIGYFAQDLDNLDMNASILDYVVGQGVAVEEARLLLACLLFRGDAVFKTIGCLSMGEKARVVFARLILSGANLLVMDEPTNYMDIFSREKIEEVLEEYNGAVLFVSHDRFFVKRLANKIFVIQSQDLITYDGNYQYYLKKTKEVRERQEIGAEYQGLSDNILRLEHMLSLLSVELSRVEDEEEKQRLDQEFIDTARELAAIKNALERK